MISSGVPIIAVDCNRSGRQYHGQRCVQKIGGYADKQARDATDDVTRAAWGEGGAARVMLHSLVGAVMGLSGSSVAAGALGAGVSAALMPMIAKALKDSGLSDKQQDSLAT